MLLKVLGALLVEHVEIVGEPGVRLTHVLHADRDRGVLRHGKQALLVVAAHMGAAATLQHVDSWSVGQPRSVLSAAGASYAHRF